MGFLVQGLGFRGLGLRVQGLGFRGLGFREGYYVGYYLGSISGVSKVAAMYVIYYTGSLASPWTLKNPPVFRVPYHDFLT